MIAVEIPEIGETWDFPDNMSDDEISEVIRTKLPDFQQSAGADIGKRIGRGAVEGVGKALQGAARLTEMLGRAGAIGPFGDRTPLTPEQREEKLQRNQLHVAGQALVEAGEEVYNTNPARDEKFISVLAESAGGLLPTIASGLVAGPAGAVAQYGLSAGETGAEEAVLAGRPEAADLAFLGNAGVGAVTEAILGGAPRFLRILKRAQEAGVRPETFGAAIKAVGGEALKTGVSEASQETLEQIGSNLIAKYLYDPDRPTIEGVAESAGAGFILGGALGGGAKGLNLVDRQKRLMDSANRAEQDGAVEAARALRDISEGLTRKRAVELDAELAAAAPERTVPESPETIQAQIKLTGDPKSAKAVTLVPSSYEEQNGKVKTPEGMVEKEIPGKGTAIINPAKTDPETVTGKGTDLGLSQDEKPSGSDVVVTATLGGTEVQTEVVANTPEAIAKATAAAQAAAPEAVVEVSTAQEVIKRRKGGEKREGQRKEKGQVPVKPEAKPQPAAKPAGVTASLSADDQTKLKELQARLRAKLGGTNLGVDPEIVTLGAQMAGLYVKAGVKKFGEFARNMKADMPDVWEQLKKYLHGIWTTALADNPDIEELTRAQAQSAIDEAEKAEQPVADADKPAESRVDSGGTGGSQPATPGQPGGQQPTAPADQGEGGGTRPGVREGDAEQGSGGGTGGGGVADADADRVPGVAGPTPPVGESAEVGGESAGTLPGKGIGGLPAPTQKQPNLRLTKNPAPTTAVARINANIRAIEILKLVQKENRLPTEPERLLLAQWSGWGSFKELFNEGKAKRRDYDPGWASKYGKHFDRLKALLTDEEFQSAAESSVNAHYTSKEVVDFLWKVAERIGFKGGRVLEPAAGSGVFLGYAPDSVASRNQWTAVEMDQVTGQILGHLYPQADTRVQPFEDTKIPNAHFELAISNVPFHETGPGKEYPSFNLHNYFLARMLDKVRPGGFVIAITTKNTMESRAEQRAILADKAQLIAAIRLPNNAFKESADTEVVTDILVLRKPDGQPVDAKSWRLTRKVGESGGEPIVVNEYFADNPDMVLGTHSMSGSMYGAGKGKEYTVIGEGELGPKLNAALAKIPTDIALQPAAEPVNTSQLEDYSLVLDKDGKVLQSVGFRLGVPDWQQTKPNIERARDYVRLRDSLLAQYRIELDPKSEDRLIELNRTALAREYKRFREKHGTLNLNKHVEFLSSEPSYYTVLGLENIVNQPTEADPTQTKQVAVPADVLTKRVMLPDVPPGSADNAIDALGVSLAYRGTLDIGYLMELTGFSEEQIESELFSAELAFRDPDSGRLTTSTEYLSGDVREKLSKAIFAAKEDARFQRNADALRLSVPKDIPFEKVKAPIGGRWIPLPVLNAFANRVMGLPDGSVVLIPKLNEFGVLKPKGLSSKAKADWSTDDIPADEMLSHALRGEQAVVYRTVEDEKGNKKRVVEPAATALANQVVARIEAEFEKYIRTSTDTLPYQYFDADRGEHVTDDLSIGAIVEAQFNKEFNSFVVPEYDGSSLKLPGLSTSVRRTPHMLSGVMRAIQTGSAVFAHGVGSGKTFLQIVAAHELKRIGLAKKPVIVVKKPTIGQFRASIERAYPGSKILIPSKNDFDVKKRKKLVSRIASGRWDLIILTHEQLGLIKTGEETVSKFFQEQIEELKGALAEMGEAGADEAKSGRGQSPSVRQIVRQIKTLKKKLDKILHKAGEVQDIGITWEQLGVDALFVDESHNFKKMPLVTKLNVKGVPSDFSDRAIFLLLKIRDVQRKTNGRNVFFASGTPVSNTMAELWVMFNAVNPKLLDDFGLSTFDAFAASFAEVVSNFEMTFTGAMKDVDRMSRFINGGPLTTLTRLGMDVKIGNKELGLDVPDLENGKPKLTVVPPHSGFDRWLAFLDECAEAWESLDNKGRFIYSWVPVTLMKAGVAAALDMRCLFQDSSDHPDSKVNKAVPDIYAEWVAGRERRTTMMVFADQYNTLSTEKLMGFIGGEPAPEISEDDMHGDLAESDDTGDTGASEEAAKAAAAVGSFNLYDDIRNKLVAMGVPRAEIAVITEYDKDKDREALFNKVRSGAVRILIGSTEKIGEGVDVPQRMSAQFHLDPPGQMTPAKLEQRLGRIIRQGNLHSPGNWNSPVRVNFYAQERSMDAAIYDMLERKAKMVIQALKGQYLGDEFEDPASDLTATMSELKAAATGDGRILKMAQLTKDVRDLNLALGAHQRAVSETNRAADEAAREGRRLIAEAQVYDAAKAAVAPLVAVPEQTALTHIASKRTVVGEDAIGKFLTETEPLFRQSMIDNRTASASMGFAMGNGVGLVIEGTRSRINPEDINYRSSFTLNGTQFWTADLTKPANVVNVLRALPKSLDGRRDRWVAQAEEKAALVRQYKEKLAGLKFDREEELKAKEKELFEVQQSLRHEQAEKRAAREKRKKEGVEVAVPGAEVKTEPVGPVEGPAEITPLGLEVTAAIVPLELEREMIRTRLSEIERLQEAEEGAYKRAGREWGSPEAKAELKRQKVRATEAAEAGFEPEEPERLKQRLGEIEKKMLAWLEGLKAPFTGTTQLFGVIPAVWNAAIDVAKLAVKAGRTIAEAISEAVDYIRANQDEPFDETKAREALGKTATKAAEGPDREGTHVKRKTTKAFNSFPDEEKLLYFTQTERGRAQFARQWIAGHGGDLEESMLALNRPDTVLNDALRTVVLAEVQNGALTEWQAAENPVDRQRWLALAKRANLLAQNVGSEQGQGLQAQQQRIRMAVASGPLMDYLTSIGKEQELVAKRFPDVKSDAVRAVLVESADASIEAVVQRVASSKVVVSNVLRGTLKEMGITVRQILERSARYQRAAQEAVYLAIRQHPALSNLTPDEALELTNLLATAWMKERVRLINEEIAKRLPKEDARRVGNRIPELIRLANLGALNVEAVRNLMAPEYGLKAFDEELARELYRMAQKAQEKPEGAQRDEAMRGVYDHMKIKAGIPLREFVSSWWYAAVLSGMGTQGRNTLGNASVLVDNFLAASVRNPRNTARYVGAVLRGMLYNAAGGEFGAILRRGASAGRFGMDVREASNALELARNDVFAFRRLISNLRFVPRFMLAVDSFFYDANVELAATMRAFSDGRAEGVGWPHIDAYIAKRLMLDPEMGLKKYEGRTAREQAALEVAAGRTKASDLRRREIEILEQERPLEIQESTHRFGLEGTLNNTPDGLLGALFNGIVAARKAFPPFTAIVPFARISANVGNMLLQHSPAGLYYVLRNWNNTKPDVWAGRLIGTAKDISTEEYQQLRAKVFIAHAAMIGVWALAAANADDDDPWFQVTGSMEGVEPAKRRQLEEQGLRRYSIKVGGRSFDYRQSPLAVVFATVGAWMDNRRYDAKWDEKDAAVKLATALAGGKAAVLDQNFLSNLAVLVDRGPQLSKDSNNSAFMQLLGRSLGGFVPTITKEVDTWFAPNMQKATDSWDYFQRELPIARRFVGPPIVNVLGEPVDGRRLPWSWLTKAESSDPVWQALGEKAAHGVFLPMPSAAAKVTVGGKREKMTPEQFSRYQIETGRLYRERLERDLERFKKMTPEQAREYFEGFDALRARARGAAGRAPST